MRYILYKHRRISDGKDALLMMMRGVRVMRNGHMLKENLGHTRTLQNKGL